MNEQKTYTLHADARTEVKRAVKKLRSAGLVPAVLYGHHAAPELLQLKKAEYLKVADEAGTAGLIDLVIGEAKAVKVLLHEPQFHPVSGAPIHADFYRVRMDTKIKTEIPLEFIGTSEAAEQLGGSLVTNRDNIEVECLPADLISNLEVDITSLKTFEDSITVADLKVPEKITVLTDKDEVVALVEPPRSEEELAELEQPTAAEEEKEALEKMEAEAGVEKGEEAAEGETPEGEPAAEEKTPEKS